MSRRLLAALLATFLVALGTLAVAKPGVLEGFTRRPAGSVGTVVVPDHFVRPWDPVTVFFAADLGPRGGGPEDRPERFVRVTPDHPGAWTWVDRRTLQFRPADPWPPMADFTWEAGTTSVDLVTLMSPPSSSIPSSGATGLDPVRAVTLTFPQAMEARALARMVSLELRPLPGIGAGPSRWLESSDFTVKAMERPRPDSPATYVLELDEAVPLGTRAVVHFRLATDDRAEEAFARLSFSTAEPFRAVRAGCRNTTFPLAPEGVAYGQDQALGCGSGDRSVIVDFSATPVDLGPVQGRNLVRLEPAVENLSWSLQGRRLVVRGDYEVEQLYKLTIAPTALTDTAGRSLDLEGASEVWVHFPRKPAYLKLARSRGVLERQGPLMVPLEGRGQGRVDLRIHEVDPLDRSLWPFPDQPVSVDEGTRPPGPGEEPEAHTSPGQHISSGQLYQHLRSLGSPEASALVDLPLRPDGGAARFGLDLSEHLRFVSGRREPGHYLVGVRPLDGSTTRSWMRIQVTDLSLTAVEEPRAVRFAVTSLSTGRQVSGATVLVEGAYSSGGKSVWKTLFQGRTDGQGSLTWRAPGGDPHSSWSVRRIRVEKGDDVLVLDPTRPPESYADSHWSAPGDTWLQWTTGYLDSRGPQARELAHIFTERPVYKPEEEVHVKGWFRHRLKGVLSVQRPAATVVVAGPGGLEWRYPVQLTDAGGFYHRFQEDNLPTGVYRAWLEVPDRGRLGAVEWKMEAYRLPRFEVQLHGEDTVPLDAPFEVELTADYYAGGKVAAQPVRWRVTPYPYAWRPGGREGFAFSSDSRYSQGRRFDAAPREEYGQTDAEGHASLVVDPTAEASALPRTYVLEATVTGADDQTVTATHRVKALPAFALGLKAPRFLERATAVRAEVIAVGPDGALFEDQEVAVRLKHRQWHSHLRASDFTDGVARYVTDVVDEVVSERVVRTTSEPLVVSLPVEVAGVYLVELESRDRLGRAQVVEVDLYAGGDEAVSWSKPEAGVFSIASDATAYEPGDTAALVLQSPWQEAEALVVIEAPEGNRYRWVKVRGGAATVRLPMERTWVPRIPVHAVLLRGRVPGTRPDARAQDLGRPQTLAATTWLKVEPVENQVEVEIEHPEKAAPGETIPVTLTVRTPRGEPSPAEVALWLVDAAVLALGKEQRLDPLPDFITPVRSHLSLRDTRNLVFGFLPFEEMPGGDGEEMDDEEAESLMDRATVRKDFRSVPYYQPALQVPASGELTVQVKLPDNLTVFKVRAKAASGAERFGYGKSSVRVRLPVIVQPTLPRFVRPGDSFSATAISRVVEGEGGAGTAALSAEGVTLRARASQGIALDPVTPTRVEFPVRVDDVGYAPDGTPSRERVSFKVAVERDADRVGDAFEVSLPVRSDRAPVRQRVLADLEPGATVDLPSDEGEARAGTVRRSVLVSDQAALTRMAAGMDFLVSYPYGCTEQRLSKARTWLALGRFRDDLNLARGAERTRAQVESTLAWLPTVVDDGGRVAYWPGSSGRVWLTAASLEFMVEAREAGYAVDEALVGRLVRSLKGSLRSDSPWLISGAAYYERSRALRALARAGHYDEAYFAELARKAEWQQVGGVSQVVLAAQAAGQGESASAVRLASGVSDQVVLRLHQGTEIYGGLKEQRTGPRQVLPSEARTLSEVSRALTAARPDDPKATRVIDALVTQGGEDGWGSTAANAEALMALADHLESAAIERREVEVTQGGDTLTLSMGGEDGPTGHLVQTEAPEARLTWSEDDPGFLWAELTYLPAKDGSWTEAAARGFAVTRRWEQVLAADRPPRRTELDRPGQVLELEVGDVVEERVQVVVPDHRVFVAITVPLAAGMEPLNPNLATAPPEARPTGRITRAPTYAAYLDDHVAFYYDDLPTGTYEFAFRTRAGFEGSFVQPPALAEDMYDAGVYGNSAGARVEIAR